MSQYMPDDLWVEVIALFRGKARFCERRDLRNLSLTCKRLRRLSLPFLYYSLMFSLPNHEAPEEITAALFRALGRALELQQAHHLLRHVRELSLIHWVFSEPGGMTTNLPLPDGGLDDICTDIIGLQSASVLVYDLVAGLVHHMPMLRHLELWHSPMTYSFYHAASSCSLLKSLYVVTSDQFVAINIPVNIPRMHHIRHLHYTAGFSHSAERYIAHILDHCMFNLETLGIHSGHLHLVTSRISGRALSLRSLHVTYPFISTDIELAIALWNVLRATPELQSLVIHGDLLENQSQHVGPEFLPRLVEICSTPNHVHALVARKHVTSIRITQLCYVHSHSISAILPCSTLSLRKLTMRVPMAAPGDLFAFLRSLCTFRNLEYLQLSYQLQNIDWQAIPDLPVCLSYVLQELSKLI